MTNTHKSIEEIVKEFYKACEYERGEQSTAYTHRCANFLKSALQSYAQQQIQEAVEETFAHFSWCKECSEGLACSEAEAIRQKYSTLKSKGLVDDKTE
jgi:hypothetical protein